MRKGRKRLPNAVVPAFVPSTQRNDKPGGLDETRYLDATSSLQQCRSDQRLAIRGRLYVAVVFGLPVGSQGRIKRGAISARSHIKNGIALCTGTPESLRALGVTLLAHLVVSIEAQRARCKDVFLLFSQHP